MQLPWNKTIRLHLGADQVSGALHAAGGARGALARASQPLAASALLGGEDAAGAAIDAVLAALRHLSPRGTLALQVTLAAMHVHLDVVAGPFADASNRQLQALAQACAAEVLGDMAGQLLRWRLQADGRHLFICAAARPAVAAIEQAARRAGTVLVSLQPDFCAQWNRHATAFAGAGVFATADSAQLTVACVDGATITALSSGPFEATGVAAADWPAHPVDARSARLLASVGRDTSLPGTCILLLHDVSAPGQGQQLMPHWTVLDAAPLEQA